MKEKLRKYWKWIILGIIVVIAAVITVVVIIKDSKEYNENAVSNSLTGGVTGINEDGSTFAVMINQEYAKPDEELTVKVVNAQSKADLEYQWYADNVAIKDATDSKFTPTDKQLEKFISVKVSYEGVKTAAEAKLYCSKLPVIYINTDDGGSITTKETYVHASMLIQGNTTYNSGNTDLYNGGIEIKGRGSSTFTRDKKPYKIKLESKTDLLGMGKNKNWVLLANDIDHTLIRNKLTYDFADTIGLKYSMQSNNVAMVFNGTYDGVYQLCEHVRIDSSGIDIFDWEDLAKDAAKLIAVQEAEEQKLSDGDMQKFEDSLEYKMTTDLSWASSPYELVYNDKTYKISDYVEIPKATGGFLLEMDFYSLQQSAYSQITTAYSQPIYFNTPEYARTNNELFNYAKKYIQSFEYSLHSDDFVFKNSDIHYKGNGSMIGWNRKGGSFGKNDTANTDTSNSTNKSTIWSNNEVVVDYTDDENNGKHYSEMFDMDSLVNYFIVTEFADNWDSMKNSVFMYKDLEGLASIGPVWDYDWAFGNINMYDIDTWFPEQWHTTNDYFTSEQYYQSVQWYRYLIRDPYFVVKVYERYKEIRGTAIEDIIKADGILDSSQEEFSEAAAANDRRWNYTYKKYGGLLYKDSMKNLTEFINTRVKWMDEQFTSIPTLLKSLGYYEQSDSLKVDNVEYKGDNIVLTVSVTDNSFKTLSAQVNGTTFAEGTVNNGVATIEVPKSACTENNSLNVVQIRVKNDDGSYVYANEKSRTVVSTYATFE